MRRPAELCRFLLYLPTEEKEPLRHRMTIRPLSLRYGYSHVAALLPAFRSTLLLSSCPPHAAQLLLQVSRACCVTSPAAGGDWPRPHCGGRKRAYSRGNTKDYRGGEQRAGGCAAPPSSLTSAGSKGITSQLWLRSLYDAA